jgi:hypothetical protein
MYKIYVTTVSFDTYFIIQTHSLAMRFELAIKQLTIRHQLPEHALLLRNVFQERIQGPGNSKIINNQPVK